MAYRAVFLLETTGLMSSVSEKFHWRFIFLMRKAALSALRMASRCAAMALTHRFLNTSRQVEFFHSQKYAELPISFKFVGTVWIDDLSHFLKETAGSPQRFSTLKTVFIVLLPLASHVASAQIASDDLSATSSQASLTTQSFEWASQNRFIEIFGGQRQLDYLEADTQGVTSNGVLDTETGQQSHIGLSMRWQTSNHWLVHLQAQRQSGVTDYNGYLQAGNGTLSPYRARSGNTATQISVAMGYALSANNWSVLSPRWQITPLLQISQHQWNRNLVQYSETYTHSNYAVGAMLQWHARPGTVLEFQTVLGRTQSATVEVTSLGFFADQPGGNYSQWAIGLSQELAQFSGYQALAGWHLVAHYSASAFEHAASPTVNALQAPPNQHRPSAWTLGLRKLF